MRLTSLQIEEQARYHLESVVKNEEDSFKGAIHLLEVILENLYSNLLLTYSKLSNTPLKDNKVYYLYDEERGKYASFFIKVSLFKDPLKASKAEQRMLEYSKNKDIRDSFLNTISQNCGINFSYTVIFLLLMGDYLSGFDLPKLTILNGQNILLKGVAIADFSLLLTNENIYADISIEECLRLLGRGNINRLEIQSPDFFRRFEKVSYRDASGWLSILKVGYTYGINKNNRSDVKALVKLFTFSAITTINCGNNEYLNFKISQLLSDPKSKNFDIEIDLEIFDDEETTYLPKSVERPGIFKFRYKMDRLSITTLVKTAYDGSKYYTIEKKEMRSIY